MSSHGLAVRLAGLAPVFCAGQNQISFLSSPAHFYEAILSHIGQARKRICFATLYLGTEDLERDLIAKLGEKLETQTNSDFRAHFHMDYLRGTRGFPGECSANLLRPLLKSNLLTISMYLTPTLHGNSWRRLMVPPRWNEIFGLSHLKVCVFDDTVIMTGANLSKVYFTNRADRYVCIRDHPRLADYFVELLQIIGKFSYCLRMDNGSKELLFDEPANDICSSDQLIWDFISKYQDGSYGGGPIGLDSDAYLIPTLQMAPHHCRQDEKVMEETINWFNGKYPNADCSLATGYFNLSPLAQHIFCKADMMIRPWRILTSSPEANGFFESAGMSRFIPDAYRSIEFAFLEGQNRPKLVVNEAGEECIFEYSKKDWTFHAKGLWIDGTKTVDNDYTKNIVTVIGSSNFGYRSFERDLEAQLTIITSECGLIDRIRAERDELFDSSRMVSRNDMVGSGLPSYSVRRAASIFKSFL